MVPTLYFTATINTVQNGRATQYIRGPTRHCLLTGCGGGSVNDHRSNAHGIEDVALVVLFQATNSDAERGGRAGQCLGAHNGATTGRVRGSGPHSPNLDGPPQLF